MGVPGAGAWLLGWTSALSDRRPVEPLSWRPKDVHDSRATIIFRLLMKGRLELLAKPPLYYQVAIVAILPEQNHNIEGARSGRSSSIPAATNCAETSTRCWLWWFEWCSLAAEQRARLFSKGCFSFLVHEDKPRKTSRLYHVVRHGVLSLEALCYPTGLQPRQTCDTKKMHIHNRRWKAR